MTQEVRIPDIGDAQDVEVIEVLVAVGDQVGIDDGLIVVESDKASMEVPSPVAGRVQSVDVALGDLVTEGQLIVKIDEDSDSVAAAPADDAAEPEPRVAATVDRDTSVDGDEPKGRQPVAEQTSRRFEVRLPGVGEAEGVEVIELAVAPGDAVRVDDLLLVVESDKASMEIPSPVAGRVLEVPVQVGTPVDEGQLLVVLETDDTSGAPGLSEGAQASARPAAPEPAAAKPAAAAAESQTASSAGAARPTPEYKAKVYAGPAVRRLARELGVDLANVTGTGTRGRILKDDVHAFVKNALAGRGTGAATGTPAVPEIDFSRFGSVETVALSRIRARGAQNLTRSWLNIPHVTQHDDADVTELEAFRRSLKGEAEQQSVKLTPLAFIMRAVIHALKEAPSFNASLSPDARSMILKRYYHIGFAVDTDDGLVVPVVRDAEAMGIFDLARRIEDLSSRAREGKLSIEEASGASFTISSLGAVGGTAFTPIVNWPEVAILGVSRLSTQPRWNGTAFEPRQILPLSLSYDHRAINGAEAGRFMVRLCRLLGDIRQVLL